MWPRGSANKSMEEQDKRDRQRKILVRQCKVSRTSQDRRLSTQRAITSLPDLSRTCKGDILPSTCCLISASATSSSVPFCARRWPPPTPSSNFSLHLKLRQALPETGTREFVVK